ncbi:MAG: hypothetical protein KAH05_00910 [Clostridiales bacterium]|nr:hypothetical protein [Clostridiales bacterium]
MRKITKRNRGRSLEEIIREINIILPGWIRYFKYASCESTLKKLDGWIRRKLRCYRLKQLKRAKTIAAMLIKRGISESSAWKVAASGKGWWRLSLTNQAHKAMGVGWWKLNGYTPLYDIFESLWGKKKVKRNRCIR